MVLQFSGLLSYLLHAVKIFRVVVDFIFISNPPRSNTTFYDYQNYEHMALSCQILMATEYYEIYKWGLCGTANRSIFFDSWFGLYVVCLELFIGSSTRRLLYKGWKSI